MTIQLDLLHREQVLRAPQIVYAEELRDKWETMARADLLGLIVIEADGGGGANRVRIFAAVPDCSLKDENLDQGWRSFLHQAYPEFRRMSGEWFDELV
jgi:hypothetical protein